MRAGWDVKHGRAIGKDVNSWNNSYFMRRTSSKQCEHSNWVLLSRILCVLKLCAPSSKVPAKPIAQSQLAALCMHVCRYVRAYQHGWLAGLKLALNYYNKQFFCIRSWLFSGVVNETRLNNLELLLGSILTDPSTTFELQNPSHDIPDPHEIRRSPDVETLKLWKGRSGGGDAN